MNHITQEHIDWDDAATIARRIFGQTSILPLNGLHEFAVAAIQHYLDAQKASGWQLVPVEATPEMVDAGIASGKNRDWSYTTCYRAMLAAATQGDSNATKAT